MVPQFALDEPLTRANPSMPESSAYICKVTVSECNNKFAPVVPVHLPGAAYRATPLLAALSGERGKRDATTSTGGFWYTPDLHEHIGGQIEGTIPSDVAIDSHKPPHG